MPENSTSQVSGIRGEVTVVPNPLLTSGPVFRGRVTSSSAEIDRPLGFTQASHYKSGGHLHAG